MRVSIQVVLLLAVAVVATLWWARTRHMDFMTPKGFSGPLPDYVTQSYDPDLPPDLPDPVSRSADADPATDPSPGHPDENKLELGDLESAPGLSEYNEHSRKGGAYLARLAAALELQGEFQRALLAWERILDSCEPDESERQAAAQSILRIEPTLPRWNIDPEGDIPILLQLGTTRSASEELSRITQEVVDFLRKDSSDVVAIVPRITTTQVDGAPPRSPIAVYFTGPLGADSAQSTVLSINPPESDPEALRLELLGVIYRLIHGHLATLEGFTLPPAETDPEDPALGFRSHVTRLHWKYFAESLARPLTPESVVPDELPVPAPPDGPGEVPTPPREAQAVDETGD